jgi:hypothetical protein
MVLLFLVVCLLPLRVSICMPGWINCCPRCGGLILNPMGALSANDLMRGVPSTSGMLDGRGGLQK